MNRRVFAAALAAAAAAKPSLVPASAASTAPSPRERFPVAALRHDLDELWHALLAVGTYPFATSDRAAVTAKYRAVRAALEPMDARSFVLAVSPVFGALNDGHAGVKPGDDFVESLAVPVRCVLSGDDTIVVASHGGAIEAGSKLVSIGGVSAERIRDVTRAGWGGQTPRLRDERFVSACRIVTTILAGDPASYDVRWTSPEGLAKRATLPRATVDVPWLRTGLPHYSFSLAAAGTIGVIDYRQCVGVSAFATFLEETFRTMRDRGVRGLVVDIRNNSGGDSDLNDELWRYIATKRYTQFGPIVMRASQFLKALYGKERYVESHGIETWNAPNGTLITYSQEKVGFIDPAPNPLRFTGPVALLVGPRTFSSALDCALAAKAYKLATIVGEETSEPAATTGELFEMSTRYTATIGSFTTKYFKPPPPVPPDRGVVPDVEVATSLADELAGRDPVLARAIHDLQRAR